MPFPTPHITNIKLLAGVPLDATYRHSIYFASAGAQQSYFAGKAVSGLSWNDCMYQRENAAIRVDAPIEACEGVNYAMFQNTAYGSKWFYAFVTEHIYVNPNRTDLTIQIDVLQTWYFDYELLPCFIERQHTPTDRIGEHIAPEPLSVPEYYCYDDQDGITGMFDDWSVVMYAPFDANTYQYYGGNGANGIWNGLEETVIGRVRITMTGAAPTYSWITSPAATLQALVTSQPQLVEQVVAIVMKPTTFISHPTQQRIINRPTASFVFATAWETYTPKCKKVMTYPYTKLNVSDGAGGSRDYAFEDFDTVGGNVQFNIYADRCPNESLVCVPSLYKGITNDITQAIVLSGFPMCSWASNAFMSYIAANMSNIVISYASATGSMVGGVAAIAGSAGLGSAVGGSMIASGASQIAGILGQAEQAYKQGFKAQGNVNNSTFFTMGKKGFEFRTLGPRLEELKIIDDYFNMYGYALHIVDRPNLNARPHWTFIKTVNSTAAPAGNGAPANALTEIQRIFDNGVTFWVNAAEVGDYSLDNSV